jgi:hypothetical protein
MDNQRDPRQSGSNTADKTSLGRMGMDQVETLSPKIAKKPPKAHDILIGMQISSDCDCLDGNSSIFYILDPFPRTTYRCNLVTFTLKEKELMQQDKSRTHIRTNHMCYPQTHGQVLPSVNTSLSFP